MQGWRVRVVRNGEPEAVYQVTPKVVVEFERFHKVGLAKAFQEQQKLEHIYWLGWAAERASGRVVPVFDQWLDEIENVDMETPEAPFDGTA